MRLERVWPYNLLNCVFIDLPYDYVIPNDLIETIEYVTHMYLTENENSVIRYRLIDKLTQKEIASKLGLSASRIGQIEVKAYQKLRNTRGKLNVNKMLYYGIDKYIKYEVGRRINNIYECMCEDPVDIAKIIYSKIDILDLPLATCRKLNKYGIRTIWDILDKEKLIVEGKLSIGYIIIEKIIMRIRSLGFKNFGKSYDRYKL